MINKIGLDFAVVMALAAAGEQVLPARANERLKISAFKDITAFVLDQLDRSGSMDLEVKYVNNATEAHSDLKEQKADLVFMSYDDTLSIAFQENHRGIVAVMPVHGGILDLCGKVDIGSGKVNIGIDTDTGYARALRAYLRKSYAREDYEKLHFIFAGATNIRYEQLLQQDDGLDATLLNPPYSYGKGINRIYRLYDAFGAYQGVVGNTNRSWLANPDNEKKLNRFARIFYETVQGVKDSPAQSIKDLQDFYGIAQAEAAAAFQRLWQPDGLCSSGVFDKKALAATREVFIQDTSLSLADSDDFTLNPGNLTPSGCRCLDE